MLCCEASFGDRPPTPDDVAAIGMVDLDDGEKFIPLGETSAFNWQQGARLQWLPHALDRLAIYNAADASDWISIMQDVHTGETRRLPRPMYEVSPDGSTALTVDFTLLQVADPGYGYPPLKGRVSDYIPTEDGIWLMDLDTGEHNLIITREQLCCIAPRKTGASQQHWQTGSRNVDLGDLPGASGQVVSPDTDAYLEIQPKRGAD